MPNWGGPVVRWITDKITFPSPPSSYSLTSHPELFFIKSKKDHSSYPGVPCMLYAIPQGAPVVLVHVHSNGCDIGDMRQMLQSISEQLRVHVMSFELPGYGLHIGSACNRGTIDRMAGIVRDFLLEDLGLNPAQVVWYGRSIGSGPAIYQAHFSQTELKKQPAGLIVQCAYASFPELAGHLFGNWVKCLVPVNWPNEAMIKDIHCPLLILHGRADTMIPISQAERNFAAVSPEAKNLSRFHACECGHNDFNFQRCTLRPIYDFLLGIISSESFPTTNFNIDLDQSRRAFVYHVGPLRNKIPVYSFRRPELDDWIRRVLARKQQVAIRASENKDVEQDNVTAQAMERRGNYEGVISGFQKQALEGPGKASSTETPKSPEETPTEGTKVKKKGKKKPKKEDDELPPIPDFCEFPPLQEIEEALLDSEGLIRTCALRLEDFLQQLQKQIDSIHDLEGKPIEEIIDFVEAEFWASDPLICLWEEVRLSGDSVRIRLGPFYIDSSGKSGYDPNLSFGRATNSSPDLMRVPLWVFCPSTAHFRCLAEWALLQSPRLLRRFPAKSSVSCRCNPCRCCRRKRKTKGRRAREPTAHPTRGALATSLAAHFANWVDKTEEVRGILSRFVSLYRQPQQALGRSVSAALAAAGLSQEAKDILSATAPLQDGQSVAPPSGQIPSQPHQPDSDTSPTVVTSSPPAAREIPYSIAKMPSSLQMPPSLERYLFPSSGESAPAQDPAAWRYADFTQVASSSSGSALRPPWSASMFSAACRMCLRENSGAPGSSLCEFYARLWRADAQKVGGLPAVGEFKACSDLVSAHPATVPDRNSDWLAACIILHYNRLPRRPLNEAPNTDDHDFLRAEARHACLTVNKAMKVFAHSEHRERREQLRQRFRPVPKVPLPLDVPPEGELAETRPGPTMGKPANPANIGGETPTPERTSQPATLSDTPSSVVTDGLSVAVAPPPSSRTL